MCADTRGARIFRAHGAVAWSFGCSQIGFAGANVRRYARGRVSSVPMGRLLGLFGVPSSVLLEQMCADTRGGRVSSVPMGRLLGLLVVPSSALLEQMCADTRGGASSVLMGHLLGLLGVPRLVLLLEPSERVRDDTTESNSPRESGFSFMSIDWNAIRLSLKNRSAALQSKFFLCQKLES